MLNVFCLNICLPYPCIKFQLNTSLSIIVNLFDRQAMLMKIYVLNRTTLRFSTCNMSYIFYPSNWQAILTNIDINMRVTVSTSWVNIAVCFLCFPVQSVCDKSRANTGGSAEPGNAEACQKCREIYSNNGTQIAKWFVLNTVVSRSDSRLSYVWKTVKYFQIFKTL